jgi:D-alanyl-D-alanine carboxypeptidase (penicillin-binding protein 5/6)
MIKKALICLFLFSGNLFALPLAIDTDAASAILMNADSGRILWEKNSHESHYPASITKIATVLYTLQVADEQLHELIEADSDVVATISADAKKRSGYTLPAWWLEPDGTHMGIKKGESLPLRDLLYGIMLISANDAANMVARYVGGTIPQFMTELNGFLRTIGMHNTTFQNPHGLHHPGHKTTAHDMALLAQEALRSSSFSAIVSSTRHMRPKTNKQEASPILQSNDLLRKGRKNYYTKAIGIKTGYTSLAQHTLVAAARDKSRTLIAVLLKNEERQKMFADAIKLFEAAFSQTPIERKLVAKGLQPYETEIQGADRKLKTYASEDFSIHYFPAEEPLFQCFLSWHKLTLPIKEGEEVATLQFFEGDKLAFEHPLFAVEELNEKKGILLPAILASGLLLFLLAFWKRRR